MRSFRIAEQRAESRQPKRIERFYFSAPRIQPHFLHETAYDTSSRLQLGQCSSGAGNVLIRRSSSVRASDLNASSEEFAARKLSSASESSLRLGRGRTPAVGETGRFA